jgi:hypothetical protein
MFETLYIYNHCGLQNRWSNSENRKRGTERLLLGRNRRVKIELEFTKQHKSEFGAHN